MAAAPVLAPIITFKFVGHTEQGVRRSARILARAALASGFKGAQAFTPETSGPGNGHAAYARASKGPILKKGAVDTPDFYLYFDPDLFKPDIRGLREKSVVVLNTKDKFPATQLRKKKIKLFTLDATGIALNTIGRAWPASPMLGALAKGWNKVGIKTLKSAIEAEAGALAAEQSKAAEEGMKAAR